MRHKTMTKCWLLALLFLVPGWILAAVFDEGFALALGVVLMFLALVPLIVALIGAFKNIRKLNELGRELNAIDPTGPHEEVMAELDRIGKEIKRVGE